MSIRFLSKTLMWLLWLSTLSVALCWLFWKNAPFEPEPITVVLGLISTAVTALISEFDSRLQEEEYSLPYALAYGYANNFLEPLITQLLKTAPLGSTSPRLYVYLPEKLSELEPRSIDSVIGRIRMKNFQDNVVNLTFQEGRARDVLTVSRSDTQRVYFDFPNTLLSLNSLVEYKMESKKNQFSDSGKDELGKNYIGKFREVLEKMIKKKGLNAYVFFVDKDLNFEFD